VGGWVAGGRLDALASEIRSFTCCRVQYQKLVTDSAVLIQLPPDAAAWCVLYTGRVPHPIRRDAIVERRPVTPTRPHPFSHWELTRQSLSQKQSFLVNAAHPVTIYSTKTCQSKTARFCDVICLACNSIPALSLGAIRQFEVLFQKLTSMSHQGRRKLFWKLCPSPEYFVNFRLKMIHLMHGGG